MTDDTSTQAAWIKAALDRYESALIRYASSITGDLEQARDVVQDTFLRLCTADKEEVQDRLAAWLYTVCRNRALDVRKKEGRMQPLSDAQSAALAHGGAGPGAVAARNEVQGLVFDTVQTLPDDQQEAFRLKFQDELTYREISQVMGKSLGTVNRLITAALVAVRGRMKKSMEEPIEESLR